MLQKFGFRIIVGDPQAPFGNGKTYFTTLGVKQNERAIRIGNYNSSHFDYTFRTTDELMKILNGVLYMQENLREKKDKIQVVIIIDESALYFGARDFKNFPRELSDFIVQLRKVQVYMPIITQSINMIDKNFRRLSQDVVMYTPLFGLFTIEKQYIAHNPEEGINFVDDMSTQRVYTGVKLHPRVRQWLKLGHPDYDTFELLFPGRESKNKIPIPSILGQDMYSLYKLKNQYYIENPWYKRLFMSKKTQGKKKELTQGRK